MRALQKGFGHTRTGLLWTLALLLAAAPLSVIQKASALSGNGILSDPYLITSCADFKDIPDDMDAVYRLENDIDCTADGDTISIGNNVIAFMGTFLGNNNTITINIDDTDWAHDVAGLFNYIASATITDLTIDGSIVTDVSTGALAGYVEFTSISNVHILAEVTGGNATGGMIGETSNTTISASSVTADVEGSNYVGGIIGHSQFDTISDSSYEGNVLTSGYTAGGIAGRNNAGNNTRLSSTGTVTAYSIAGGLYGAAESASSTQTTQSYSTCDVTTTLNIAGGLAGELTGSYEIADSYARGDITGNHQVGGIAGFGTGSSIRRSYASGSISATAGTEVGGLLGLNLADDATIVDSYWNYLGGSNPTTTAGNTQIGAVLAQWSIDMILLQTYTTKPELFAPWDFDTVWGMNEEYNDGFPFLQWQGYDSDPRRDFDGVRSSVEDNAPNQGDANNDGIPDAEQHTVVSLVHSTTGKYVSVSLVDVGCNFDESWGGSVATVGSNSFSGRDVGYSYPGGFLDFTAACASVPNTIDVTVYFYGLDDADFVARKYNPHTKAYFTVPGAHVSTQTIGGQRAHVVSYQMEDGGELDADGIINGLIVDPIGLGVAALAAPNTGVAPVLDFLSKPKN